MFYGDVSVLPINLVEINSFQLLCTAHYVDICCWEFCRISSLNYLIHVESLDSGNRDISSWSSVVRCQELCDISCISILNFVFRCCYKLHVNICYCESMLHMLLSCAVIKNQSSLMHADLICCLPLPLCTSPCPPNDNF
jgi:hypothetical protein